MKCEIHFCFRLFALIQVPISPSRCLGRKLHRTNRTSHRVISLFSSGALLHVQHSCNLKPSSREVEHAATAAKQPQLGPPLSASQILSITVATPNAQTVGLDRSCVCVRGRLSRPCDPYLPLCDVWQLAHQRTSARHSFLAQRFLFPGPPTAPTKTIPPLWDAARSVAASCRCEPASLIIPAWGSGCAFLG